MQHNISSMIGYAIRATDGDLGKVDEFYFDDETWTIRYIVVETGNWLSGRKVLISPVAFGKPECESRTFSVNLTRTQVRSSPNIDTQRPIYRQQEVELHEHYQWPWRGGYGGTFGTIPLPLSADEVFVGAGRLLRQGVGMIRICEAHGRSPATIFMPLTAKSVMWKILLLTMKIGRFAFWWWIPTTGCRGRKFFYRPNGSSVCNGPIPACILTSRGNP